MIKKKSIITILVVAAIVGAGISINAVLPILASQTYDQKMAVYEKAMAQYQKDLEEYNIKVKECEDIKSDYRNKLNAYNITKAKYDEDLKKYEEAVKRLRESANKEGHISIPTGQSLIFKSEPDANLSIVANGVVTANRNVELAKGQTAVATYTDLKNTTYAGQKIAKVVYTYTSKDDAGNTVIIDKDPTVTVTIKNRAGSARGVSSTVGMKVEFYKQDGSKVAFTEEYPAIIAFNSLNRTKAYTGSGLGESIKNLSSNIQYVSITGSAVQYKNGVISSSVYNDYKANGSRFNANNASTDPMYGDADYWDGRSQPNRWYGAAAGIVKSGDSISFDIHNGSASDASQPTQGNFWLTFNSNVASVKLPENPVAPTKPEEPNCVPPQKPTPPVKPEEPVCNIRVRHLDNNGNELIKTKKVFDKDQSCGNPYSTSSEDNIPGYRFVRMHKDSCRPSGNLGEEECDIIYIYEKIVDAPNTGSLNSRIPFFILAGTSILTTIAFVLIRKR